MLTDDNNRYDVLTYGEVYHKSNGHFSRRIATRNGVIVQNEVSLHCQLCGLQQWGHDQSSSVDLWLKESCTVGIPSEKLDIIIEKLADIQARIAVLERRP